MCPKATFFLSSPCLEFLSENAVNIPLAPSMCWLVQEKLFLSRKKVFPGGWFHKCSHICCICESGWSCWGDGLNWDSVLVTPSTPLQCTSTWPLRGGRPRAGSLRRGKGGIGILVTWLRLLTVYKKWHSPWTTFCLRTLLLEKSF